MTKRLVAAVCIILIALTVGIFSYLYIKNASDEIVCSAEKLNERILSGKEYLPEYEALCSLSVKHLPYFSMILKHSDADVIKNSLINLEYAVKSDDTARISIILSELIAFITVIAEGEKPVAENIF